MGKNLIIKGADFSDNAIIKTVEIYTNNTGGVSLTGTFINGNYFATTNVVDNVKGKTINVVRLPETVNAGIVTLKVIDASNGFDAPVTVDTLSFEVPKIVVPTNIILPRNLIIPDGDMLFYSGMGILKFRSGEGYPYFVIANNVISYGTNPHYQGIDFGFEGY